MSFSGRAAVLCVLLAAASCRRVPQAGYHRVAILPFENLTPDPSLDWIQAAGPAALTSATGTSKAVRSLAVGSLRDIPAVKADRTLYTYLTGNPAQPKLRASLRDNRTQKSVQSVAAEGGTIAELLSSLARQLAADAEPRSYKVEALRQYGKAVQSASPEEALNGFRQAAAADPSFGPAWLQLTSRLTSLGRQAEANTAMQSARSAAALTPAEQAQLDLISATAAGDPVARRKAIEDLLETAPEDTELRRTLAGLQMASGEYGKARENFERVTARDPLPADWNQKAFAEAYSGDLAAALRSLEQYRKLAPEDANALDSTGEVNFLFGKFAEAERYFREAHQKDPKLMAGGDLFRAAFARLHAGDRAGADAVFDEYLEFRKTTGDRLTSARKAMWLYISGRQAEAREQAASSSEPLERAQSCIWRLQEGDFPGAEQMSRALPSSTLASVCRLLAGPDGSAAEWKTRIDAAVRAPNASALREEMLGYGLLLRGEFADAVQVFEQSLRSATPTSADERKVLLAIALDASGQKDRARQLLSRYPSPPRNLELGFYSLQYPAYLAIVRGAQPSK